MKINLSRCIWVGLVIILCFSAVNSRKWNHKSKSISSNLTSVDNNGFNSSTSKNCQRVNGVTTCSTKTYKMSKSTFLLVTGFIGSLIIIAIYSSEREKTKRKAIIEWAFNNYKEKVKQWKSTKEEKQKSIKVLKNTKYQIDISVKEKSEKQEKQEKNKKQEKSEKQEKNKKSEKSEKSEKQEKNIKSEKSEKQEKNIKSEKSEKSEKSKTSACDIQILDLKPESENIYSIKLSGNDEIGPSIFEGILAFNKSKFGLKLSKVYSNRIKAEQTGNFDVILFEGESNESNEKDKELMSGNWAYRGFENQDDFSGKWTLFPRSRND